MTHAEVFMVLVKTYFVFGLFLLAAASTQIKPGSLPSWPSAIVAGIGFVLIWPWPLARVLIAANKK